MEAHKRIGYTGAGPGWFRLASAQGGYSARLGFSLDQTNLKTTEVALATEPNLLDMLRTVLPDSVISASPWAVSCWQTRCSPRGWASTAVLQRRKHDWGIFTPKIAPAEMKSAQAEIPALRAEVVRLTEAVSTRLSWLGGRPRLICRSRPLAGS